MIDKTMRELMEHVNGIGAEDFQHLREYSEDEDIAEELEEIQGQMLDLLGMAKNAVSGTPEASSAESYWIAHIEMALSNDHGYLGGSMTTMQDTIDALRAGADEDDDWDEDEENIPGENDPLKR
jgi:hypothetical protein